MRQDGLPNVSFPRPGPATLAVLIAITVVGIGNALAAKYIFTLLACIPDQVLAGHAWQLLTAGFVTKTFWQLLFSLAGVYFFSTELERRWGRARYLQFFVGSIVIGYALAVVVHLILPPTFAVDTFHPPILFGAGAAITAMVIAWTMRNPHAEVRVFFVLPLSGRILFWMTVAFCFAGLIFRDVVSSEGAVAPFGGLLTALVFSGEASPLRTLYLKAKLVLMKRRARGSHVQAVMRSAGITGVGKGGSVSNIGDRPSSSGPRPSGRISRAGGPPLRVVYGGLEEELRSRKPPKDKRDLN